MKVLFLFIFVIFILAGCEKEAPDNRPFGVVLAVDDGYIDQWYEYIDYFTEHDVRLTFYITRYPWFTPEQKEKVRQLEERGHEIGFHGTKHENAAEYIVKHSLEEYLQKEIFTGLDSMRADGFNVCHFAYPYGISNKALDTLLMNTFLSIRKISWISESKKVKDLEDIYYPIPCSDKIICGACIDSGCNTPLSDIYEAIEIASVNKKALLLFCHRLGDFGGYSIPVQRMKSLVQYCYDHKVPMISLGEMYGSRRKPLKTSITRIPGAADIDFVSLSQQHRKPWLQDFRSRRLRAPKA